MGKLKESCEFHYAKRLLWATVAGNNLFGGPEAINCGGDNATSVSRAFADWKDAGH